MCIFLRTVDGEAGLNINWFIYFKWKSFCLVKFIFCEANNICVFFLFKVLALSLFNEICPHREFFKLGLKGVLYLLMVLKIYF